MTKTIDTLATNVEDAEVVQIYAIDFAPEYPGTSGPSGYEWNLNMDDLLDWLESSIPEFNGSTMAYDFYSIQIPSGELPPPSLPDVRSAEIHHIVGDLIAGGIDQQWAAFVESEYNEPRSIVPLDDADKKYIDAVAKRFGKTPIIW